MPELIAPARPRLRGLLLVPLLGLVTCGPGEKAPTGPFATPSASTVTRVAQRTCATPGPSRQQDLQFISIQLIRQGTDLDRVGDDISGAVPGGNVSADAQRALHDAQQIDSSLKASILCQPLKDQLGPKARDLVAADSALVNAAGAGGDTTSALNQARTSYQALAAAAK